MANLSTQGSADVAHNLAEADHAAGVPETGTKALTVAPGEHEAEPSIGGFADATVIVAISMTAFILILLWKKVPSLITAGLDKQIAAIRTRLDEAKQLRAEAEALRDEYARKLADVENQTRAIVAHAEDEAKAVVAKAKIDAAELVTRRAKMAEDKIAAAERAALAEVKGKVADAATRAAATLIAAKHDAGIDKRLVDTTIAGLGRPN